MHRRAPFIWTARQRIDPGGLIRIFMEGDRPNGGTRREEPANRWFLFRRRLDLPAAPDEAQLSLTVDGRYQLRVNGALVGRGPVRCDPHFQRVDTHDVAAHLRGGENAIALLVRVYGVDTAWYQTVKGAWQPIFGDGALFCDGFARCGADVLPIRSDTDWRSLECTAWERDTPRANWGLPHVEVHDAREMPEGFSEPGFDDGGWDGVQILSVGGGGPSGLFGGMVTQPFPTLVPRDIPFLPEHPVAPARVAAVYEVRPQPDLPFERRLYEEALHEAPHTVENADALLRPDGEAAVVRTGGGDVSLLLDFGRIETGRAFFELEAEGGEVVDLAVAEGIPGEWEPDGPVQPARIDPHRAHGRHLLRYTARPGRQRFEAFEWSAVRWAQMTVRNAPGGLRVQHVGVNATSYPAEERGAFACSDEALTRLWEVGRYTLRCCMHDGWEDCPSREQRQWLGDVTVEALAAQAAFGPSADALNRQFLHQAAESQRPDGLTQMFAPGDHRRDALLIPDWTLQWIYNAERHWLYTGDLDTVEAIFPAIERALAWFERQVGPNGLLVDLPWWNFSDWSAYGRAGEAAPINAFYFGVLRAAARLAAALESRRAARRYEAQAERVGAALNARHWDEERGVYVDCVDPDTGARDPRVSQHTNAGLVLWEAAPRERWNAMLDYVTDPSRVVFTSAPPIAPSDAPFDPAVDVVLANTFFSHFVYRALCRAGRFDAVLATLRDRYGPMLARGATTLWESYEPTASLCHGFSATPVYQLSTEVLGVYPLSPGFERFRFCPQPADLDWAKGVFPTVAGDVHVEWRREGENVAVSLRVPPGARAELTDPSGFSFVDPPEELGPGPHSLVLEGTG